MMGIFQIDILNKIRFTQKAFFQNIKALLVFHVLHLPVEWVGVQ